mgnify:FL=1
MIPRLIVGVISFALGYFSLGTGVMNFSMGMMAVGFYLTLSALFIHLIKE